MEKETIGFVGLGIMGLPMAGHLLKAGHKVVGYDVVPASLQRFTELGGETASSAAQAAAGADVVISMVPDSPNVEAAYLGEAGVLSGARPGTLLIDMSSISPIVAQKVAAEAAARAAHARRGR
jgi:2-hydroxy-3-oxopropionate reductase